MKYPYYDLRDADYEDLVVLVCTHLLGPGVQPFSTGKDGGRDARFEGTANLFPSQAGPLVGQSVVQAKHTEQPFARFSDTDFAGTGATSVLSKEIVRVRQLVDRGELDHYLLFANRRLAGNAEEALRRRILEQTGAKSVHLFGIERLDSVLQFAPHVATAARLSDLRAPLRVSSDNLAEIIMALDHGKAVFQEARPPESLRRISFEDKNVVNKLSKNFARLIRKDYLLHFHEVASFLADPRNGDYVDLYESAVAEFNEQLVAHADQIESMDKALVNIYRLLRERDSALARNARATKLVLYYMYWHCDLGEDGS